MQSSLKLSFSTELLLGNSSRSIKQIAYGKQCIIYVSGCHIVFYSPHVDEQIAYIKHTNANISAVQVSPDEQLIAVAEYGAKYPKISIYSIQECLSRYNGNITESNQFQEPLQTLKCHRQTIDLMKFSFNSKHLVSVSNADGSMFVWEVTSKRSNNQNSFSNTLGQPKKEIQMHNNNHSSNTSNSPSSMVIMTEHPLAKNKMSKHVNMIMFDWNNDLLTVGQGYIKLWTFYDKDSLLFRKKEGEHWMMQGRTIVFGKNFVSKDYIDAAMFCPENQEVRQGVEVVHRLKGDENVHKSIHQPKLVLLSSQGFLCIINPTYSKVQKWIDLMMPGASSLQIYNESFALCGGQNSLVKIIDLLTLSLKGKFPKPPPMNYQNITKDHQGQYELEVNPDQRFPKCVGVRVSSYGYILTLYQNGTVFVWSMQTQKQKGSDQCEKGEKQLSPQPLFYQQSLRAQRSIISHNDRISCLSLLEQINEGDLCFFGTASLDNTLRLWHFYRNDDDNDQNHKNFGCRQSIDIAQIIGIKRNAYCRNLSRILYTKTEFPIFRIKLFMKKYVVCVSKKQLLMYSLETFQELILVRVGLGNVKVKMPANNKNDQQNVTGMDVSQDLIYLSYESGYVRVYKPSEDGQLLQLKEITLNIWPILNVVLFDQDRRMMVHGRTKSLIYILQTDEKIPFDQIKTKIVCVSMGVTANMRRFFVCEQKKLTYFSYSSSSTSLIKKIGQLSLSHQLQTQQNIKLCKNNASFIILLTTTNRIIVANLSSTVMYTQNLNEQITDMQVTGRTELILTGVNGNIIIKTLNDSKYKKLSQNNRKWFEEHHVQSWMDNSIWTYNNSASKSLIKNRLSDHSLISLNNKFSSIDRSVDREVAQSGGKVEDNGKSCSSAIIINKNRGSMVGSAIKDQNCLKQQMNPIQTGDIKSSIYRGDTSIFRIGSNVKDVNVEYKNYEQNKMSIFNPSNILQQANKIYQNVDGMIKNFNNQQQCRNIGNGGRAGDGAKDDSLKGNLNFNGDSQQDEEQKISEYHLKDVNFSGSVTLEDINAAVEVEVDVDVGEQIDVPFKSKAKATLSSNFDAPKQSRQRIFKKNTSTSRNTIDGNQSQSHQHKQLQFKPAHKRQFQSNTQHSQDSIYLNPNKLVESKMGRINQSHPEEQQSHIMSEEEGRGWGKDYQQYNAHNIEDALKTKKSQIAPSGASGGFWSKSSGRGSPDSALLQYSDQQSPLQQNKANNVSEFSEFYQSKPVNKKSKNTLFPTKKSTQSALSPSSESEQEKKYKQLIHTFKEIVQATKQQQHIDIAYLSSLVGHNDEAFKKVFKVLSMIYGHPTQKIDENEDQQKQQKRQTKQKLIKEYKLMSANYLDMINKIL